MNRRIKAFAAIALVVAGSLAAHAIAQSGGGPYRIERSVIAGGGASLGGGAFQLSGTFGQSATAHLSGAGLGFYGGFWPPAGSAPTDLIFANGFDP